MVVMVYCMNSVNLCKFSRLYLCLNCMLNCGGAAAGLSHEDSGRIRCVLPDVGDYDRNRDSVVLQVFSKCRRFLTPSRFCL